MIRRRWYRAAWGMPIPALLAQLKTLSFREDGFDGFVLEQTRPSFIAGEFYERAQQIDRVRDPFGNETVFERIDYRRTDFVISESKFGLEIVNPSRNVQSLISRLVEVSNFNLVLNSVDVDPMAWALEFQKILDLHSTVESIQIGSIQLDHGIAGTLLVKGKDVYDAARALVGKNEHKVDKVHLRFRKRTGSITFTSSGAITVKATISADVIKSARQALLAI